ncbi:MAG: superoxide dismutase [Candidatus Omnitrophota bacterium]
MAYQTPDLPYPYDALEPHIDKETMTVHHDKHHAGYTSKLNTAVEKHPELFDRSPEELIANISTVPEDIRKKVRNVGGGHVNHAIFWTVIGPDGGGEPEGDLADAVKEAFGSFDEFKQKFSDAATTVFGSGWAWLVVKDDGKLAIVQTANQNSPTNDDAPEKGVPILLIDVWEHAYYLKYQNKRAAYIEAFWNVIDWKGVGKRFAAATK